LNDFTYDIIDEKEGIKYQLISNLIQHPVAIKPFNFSKDRPAPELILTKAVIFFFFSKSLSKK